MYMLDTDTCVFLIRKRPRPMLDRLERASIFEVCISSITMSELEFGVRKSDHPDRNEAALIQFLAPLSVHSYGDEAAKCYGELRAALEAKGNRIGAMDMLIAAHAKSLDCVLVTNNTREFSRIPDLQIENWA